MIRRVATFALIVLVLPFVAMACDDDEPELPEGVTEHEDLPDSWPDDFPIYPGAELEGVITSTEEGASGDVATFQTGDSLDDVTEFYEGEFDGGDWVTVTDPVIAADSALFLIEQTGGGHADSSVTITAEDGSTAILVLIAQPG